MKSVFVPTRIIDFVNTDSSAYGYDVSLSNDDLFLDPINIQFVTERIVALRKQYGTAKKMPIKLLTLEVEAQMREWVNLHRLADSSVSGNQVETLDYYNKDFVKEMHPLYSVGYIPRTGDLTPDVNVMRLKQYGKREEDMYVDDIRNLDVWTEDAVYLDDYNTRKTWGNKGINQPHIVGVHKRTYDRVSTDGLSTNGEKGPERNRGYNNDALYATIGNSDASLWNKLQ